MSDKAVVVPDRANTLTSAVARQWRRLVKRQDFVVLAFFAVIVLFLSLYTDTFLHSQNLSSLARNFAWIAIVALGQSLVFIIGGIDLSVGSTLALASLIAARAMQVGLPVPLGLGAGLLVGVVIGWINGLTVARVRLPAFIVTLATATIVRGIAYGLTRGWSVTALPAEFLALGQYDLSIGSWSVPLPLLLALGIAVLISLLLNHTILGRYIYAMSSGERSLILSGVNVGHTKEAVYTLCGLLAAAGGLVMTARLGVAAPAAAIGYEVDVVAAAVIGGTSVFGGVGTTLGVLLGAGVTQMLYNGLVVLGFPSYWQTIGIGAMILTVVLLDYYRRRR
ncbi:MAG TPA: ABC transporter permease [Anaerolineae bacterium]|nr:ABC transporter permease [Anaerolineae bacterium]